MKKNMGTIDRAIRIIAAVIIGILLLTNVVEGTLAIVLGIVAAAFLLTSFVGSCPAYIPIGLSTKKGE